MTGTTILPGQPWSSFVPPGQRWKKVSTHLQEPFPRTLLNKNKETPKQQCVWLWPKKCRQKWHTSMTKEWCHHEMFGLSYFSWYFPTFPNFKFPMVLNYSPNYPYNAKMLPRTGLQPRFQGRSASSQSGPGRYLGQVPIVLCLGRMSC